MGQPGTATGGAGAQCQVYVTLNTEYHVHAQRCVAVRDRLSGRWLRTHRALWQPLCGGLRFSEDGAAQACDAPPAAGDSLLFRAEGRDLVTSPVVIVGREG